MSDNDFEMQRGRSQVMHSYAEKNVIDMGDLGVTAQVLPWLNSRPFEDIDPERLATDLENRVNRHPNRTTSKGWENVSAGNIDVYQPRRVEVRLFPTVFYCEECGKVHSSDPEKPHYLPNDGQCKACKGELTQLAFVNVCRCGKLEGPLPPRGCPNDHGYEDFRLQKSSGGPASWRFYCRKCNAKLGGMSKSCGVCNNMEGPLPTASNRIYYAQRLVRVDIPFVGVKPEDMPGNEDWARVLMSTYLGYTELEDKTLEELATEEGRMSEYEDVIQDEDPETVERILEKLNVSVEGRGVAIKKVEHLTPVDAGPDAEPADRQLAWSNVAHALFTFMRSTDGYEGDPDEIDGLEHPIPTELSKYLEKPEFREAHPQSTRYRAQLDATHIKQTWVADQFPLLNVLYGYTRADPEPSKTDLNQFRHPDGMPSIPVFADRSPSEAIIFEIDRAAIINWLVANGILSSDSSLDDDDPRKAPDVNDERELKEWFLTNIATTQLENPFDDIDSEVTAWVYTLLHSMSHCLLARAGEQCGLATETLGERIFANVPAIVVYAATTENFSLGSMSTLFKTRLHPWLSDARELAEHCLLDPACSEDPEGAACDACVYVSETSCESFNHHLDRRTLCGGEDLVGFWDHRIANSMGSVGGVDPEANEGTPDV